jgi:hypothetical protein
MLAVAYVAPVLPARPFQFTSSPGRQTAGIRAAIGARRRVFRWLALRGSPPGNRGPPDIVPLSHVVRQPPRRRAASASGRYKLIGRLAKRWNP